MGSKLTAIILAAGKGTRMKSRRAKVLHSVCGRPILRYVLDAVRGVNPDEILVVVGDRAKDVRSELASDGVGLVEQRERRGTGHAVLQAKGKAEGKALLIVPGRASGRLLDRGGLSFAGGWTRGPSLAQQLLVLCQSLPNGLDLLFDLDLSCRGRGHFTDRQRWSEGFGGGLCPTLHVAERTL